MTDVKNLTNEELKNQILAIEQEIRERKGKRHQEILAKNPIRIASLTREVVDFVAPGHSRTSCPDDNIVNQGHSDGWSTSRCVRCRLLTVINEPWEYETDTIIVAEIEFRELTVDNWESAEESGKIK